MKQIKIGLATIFLSITLCTNLHAQQVNTYDAQGEFDSKHLPVLDYHHQEEFTPEMVAHPEAWNKQSGLHVAFGSTDQLYFRKEKPVIDESTANTYQQTTWKGQRVNLQLLVWSSDTLEQVRFKFNNLKDEKGNLLPSSCFDANLVRYVISNYPYGCKEAVCGDSPYKNGFMMPDRFQPLDCFLLPAKTARPVWVSINVPSQLVGGNYTGTIEVKSTHASASLTLHLKVQNQVLPPPKDWKYRLDLWQNPWAVAYINHLKPWSPEHVALLKQHLKMYAEAGGKYITTYAVHSPWSDNSFMTEGGMIEWIKNSDGTWKFDYSIFDQYVNLAMSCGITKAITVYTAIPNGYRFKYLDAATGNYEYPAWEPGKEAFSKHWKIFLTDLRKHLQEKGWFNRTYIGINESEMNATIAAIQATKAAAPDWKITYAGDWHAPLDTLLDDYCCVYGKEGSMQQIAHRKKRGLTSTYYVCCTPPVPNNFLFSPPIEGRWISWYASAFGYDGFLRWAYDAWTEDPTRDARHGSWAAGDCYLVYPGGHSCIRFEKLREGIVDYEKIRMLREKAARVPNNKKVAQLIQQLDAQMQQFIQEKDFKSEKISNDVKQGNSILNALSDELNGL